MTHITCRLTAKNRDQLRNPTLGNWVWATFFIGVFASDSAFADFRATGKAGIHKIHILTWLHVCLLIVQTLLVRSVYTIYYAGGLTLYRCYLFVLFFIFPFISEPAHGRLLCCDELGVWCNFNILCLDSSPRPSFGEMGKLPHILPKIWRCPHLASCRKIFCKSAFDLIRLSTYKNGKIFSLSKEGYILVEKNTQVSLYPFFEEPWLTRWLPLAVRYHAISPVVRSFILYSSLFTKLVATITGNLILS